MLQRSLLEAIAPPPDLALGEPVIWLQQLMLLKSLDDPTPIQNIPFRRGLNIIATEEALPEDTLPVGHDVGKTMLIRIIRYCLGEEHYCDQETRTAIAYELPNAYVLAKVRVAKETWCVAKPLGTLPALSSSWCDQTDDLDSIRHPQERRRYRDFVEALNEATKACYADIGLPNADNRRARWQDLLGWLSRDQDCLFRHIAEWRVTESQAGPRVLRKEDAYLVMRMALGLLSEGEIEAANQCDQLRNDFSEKENRLSKVEAFLERTEDNLRTALRAREIDPDTLPGEGLLIPALMSLTEDHIASLSDRIKEVWERPDIQQCQDTLDSHIEQQGILQHRVDELTAQTATLDEALMELQNQDEETFLANLGSTGFACQYWPGNQATAKEAGCPGTDSSLKADDGSDLRRKAMMHKAERERLSVATELEAVKGALSTAREYVVRLRTDLRSRISEQFRTRQEAAESLGGWREIRQRTRDFQRACQEQEELGDDIAGKDSALRQARESIAARRKAFEQNLHNLSLCYRDVVRSIMSQEVEGEITVDGNGVHPEVRGASSAGTTLKICTQVLGYDLACLKASISGIGHLPRLWMHDSPRAADTEDSLYHRLMKIVADLEAEFGDAEPTFQHIWTTTSIPPKNLNKAPYVCLRLDAREDEGKLLKKSFGNRNVENTQANIPEDNSKPQVESMDGN